MSFEFNVLWFEMPEPRIRFVESCLLKEIAGYFNRNGVEPMSNWHEKSKVLKHWINPEFVKNSYGKTKAVLR